MTTHIAMTSRKYEILMIHDPHRQTVHKTAEDASADKEKDKKRKMFLKEYRR